MYENKCKNKIKWNNNNNLVVLILIIIIWCDAYDQQNCFILLKLQVLNENVVEILYFLDFSLGDDETNHKLYC